MTPPLISTTSSSSSSSSSPFITAAAVGGDHAGFSATFSSRSGEIIPVPEHLVPASMIEWGDIPSYLEVLVSEDLIFKDVGDTDEDEDDEQQDAHIGDNNVKNQEKKKKEVTRMERTAITVLPEVGCGIDNLETTKKVEEYNLQDNNECRLLQWKKNYRGEVVEQQQQYDVVVLDRKIGASSSSLGCHQLSVETIFQVASEVTTAPTTTNDNTNVEQEEPKVYPRRIRISFTIDTNTNHVIKDTITINIERLVSTTSTKGTRWSGPQSNSGGLDARSVRSTIGRDIVYGDVFGVKRVKSGEDVWTVTIDDNDDDDAAVRNKDAVIEGGKKTTAKEEEEDDYYSIRLPQNILVQFYNCNKESSTQSWSIELSHLDVIDSKLYKRSVLRSFDSSQDGFGSISYREEEMRLVLE